MDSPNINRRSSVFLDLLTVFRKNTTFSNSRRSIYHAPPISKSSNEITKYQDVFMEEAKTSK